MAKGRAGKASTAGDSVNSGKKAPRGLFVGRIPDPLLKKSPAQPLPAMDRRRTARRDGVLPFSPR